MLVRFFFYFVEQLSLGVVELVVVVTLDDSFIAGGVLVESVKHLVFLRVFRENKRVELERLLAVLELLLVVGEQSPKGEFLGLERLQTEIHSVHSLRLPLKDFLAGARVVGTGIPSEDEPIVLVL